MNGRFYLYRFEACRQSDPGLDLGGFAADLLCFTLANHDEKAYQTCRDAFLSRYNSKAEHPMDESDLRFYIAVALLQRLGRGEFRKEAGAERLLGALDVAVLGTVWDAASAAA